MKHEIIYAIVQFRPYLETEEFANVGVVLCAPKAGYFDYIIEQKRFKRLTEFFMELPRELPKNATQYIANELDRVKEFSFCTNQESLKRLFLETTKHREGIIRYSDVRAGIVSEEPAVKLKKLFEHHVNHSFVSKISPNDRLEAATRQILEQHNLAHIYKHCDITDTDGLVKASVPFTHQQDGLFFRIIRPLSLEFETPSAIVDVGDKWVNRFKRLFDFNVLKPDAVVMPLAFPASKDRVIVNAVNTVFGDIERAGIKPIDATDTETLVNLASV
ncbi:DUF3037 domain-containing protein [Pseudaeromonas pectinilytica]